jgi:hypothetical protein
VAFSRGLAGIDQSQVLTTKYRQRYQREISGKLDGFEVWEGLEPRTDQKTAI